MYFQITALNGDTLTGASVDPSVAAEAQIHEVVAAEMDAEGADMSSDTGDMSSDMDMSGDESGDQDGMDMDAMTMREMTDGLELPSAETISFEPGGYHVMLLDLAEPLELGDEVEVTLEFATSDDVVVTAEVADSAP